MLLGKIWENNSKKHSGKYSLTNTEKEYRGGLYRKEFGENISENALRFISRYFTQEYSTVLFPHIFLLTFPEPFP